MTAELAVVKKLGPAVLPERCGLAESKRQDFVVDVEVGIKPEDLLVPAFWAHVATQFQSGDTIEARADDFSWIAYLRVVFAERNFASVIMERPALYVESNKDVGSPASRHHVKFMGPYHRFAVIRDSDQALIKGQGTFKTREEATAWMIEHEKSIRTV